MRSSAFKKWIAMILAVFLVAGSLPNGIVVYADDGDPIITSFAEDNPVKTITYKIGETVKESDFPDTLAAVVSGTAISGEVYVDVEWDAEKISEIDTSSVGSYDIEGTVKGYTLAPDCPPPEVLVKIVEKSGAQLITEHSLEWKKGSYSTTITGNEMSMNLHTNTEASAECTIRFTIGNVSIPAGGAEIRIPKYIFEDREGNSIGRYIINLKDTSFEEREDEDTEEIVITNKIALNPATDLECPVVYYVTPYNVADGYAKNDIKATFNVDTGETTLNAESEALTLKVSTRVTTPSLTKTVANEGQGGKYETWQSDWGVAPDDAEDYFFVVWELRTGITHASQPGTLTFQEDVGENGEIVAWYDDDIYIAKKWHQGNKEEFEEYPFRTFTEKTKTNTSTINLYPKVVVKYPRTMLEDGTTTFTNKCTAIMTGVDYKREGSSDVNCRKTKESANKYVYTKVDFIYDGDVLSVTKSGGSNIAGGINILEDKLANPRVKVRMAINNRGYDISDRGKDEYTTYLEDGMMFASNERLDHEDYSFIRFSLNAFNEYICIEDHNTGLTEVLNTDYETYSAVEVWVMTKGNHDIEDDKWTHIGSVKRIDQHSFKWTDKDGNNEAIFDSGSSSVSAELPEGTYDISFRHKGSQYRVEYAVYLHYEIKPSDHILKLIDGQDKLQIYNINSGYARDAGGQIRTGSSYPTVDTTIKDQITEIDIEKYEQVVGHAHGGASLTRFAPNSTFEKVAGMTAEDNVNKLTTRIYRLTQRESLSYPSSSMSEDQVKEGNYITEQRNGIFYDLLPLGVTVDMSSIEARFPIKVDNKYVTVACSHTVEMVENWRGSGRTMMIIHVEVPEEYSNYYFSGNQATTELTVGFKTINTWDNVRDNGSDVLNSAAYYSLNGSLIKGSPDDGVRRDDKARIFKDKEFFVDLNNDGNPEDTLNNVMYDDVVVKYTGISPTESGLSKAVKALGDAYYSDMTTAAATGTYTYQIRFGTATNSKATDVVMYDVLETAYGENPSWQGTFKDVDTSHARNKGIDAKVYYSTYDEFKNINLSEMPDYTDLDNSEYWTDQKPEDLAEVTAIAIDLSKSMTGGAYTFGGGEAALCYITMEAPASSEHEYAYNSAYSKSTPEGSTNPSLAECNIVKVGLYDPDVEIHKTSDPESGTKEVPAIAGVMDSIEYHLAVSNKETAETIEKIIIEDEIPAGLSIDEGNLKCCFGDSIDKAIPVSDSPRVDVDIQGQRLTFTVDKLAAGETVHLLIPTNVKDIAASGMRFENTARITGFNKSNWDIESETTYHKTESVLVDVTAEKEWDDNNDEYGVRPESIYVQLYADGNPVEGKRAELNESNNWQYTFKSLPKYRSGEMYEIKYSIKEEDVDGYKASLSGDGLKVTNTIQTKDENEDVIFKVQKYRSGTTTAVPGAGFVLKDGDDVIARAETDENGIATFMLTPEGDMSYELTLSEEYAPDGYVLSTETWTVKLQREKDPSVTLNQEQNIFRIIWKWIVHIFTGEGTGATMEDGKLVVYNDYIEVYEPIPAEAVIKAEKTLDGLPATGSSFEFNLKDESGNIIQTKNNDGGDINFDALTFDSEGTFIYYIAEQAGSDSSIVYDDTVYKAVINVTKDKDYHAEISYERDSEPCDGIPVFTNTTKDEPKSDLTSVTVNKVWSKDKSSNRPDNVTVQLYQNGDAYGDAEILSSDNGWQHTWTELDDEYTWTVDEINIPSGYEKTVTNSGGVWTITNTSTTPTEKPEKPDKPEEPKEPKEPEKPEEPKEPKNPGDPSVDIDDPGIPADVIDIPPERPTDPGVPLTGNTSLMIAWIILAIVSVMGIITTLFGKKLCMRKQT
ncbi:Cna B-type domain-containing protein [Sedimentibacter hydroxybenzoicus DSM 7310]|uniref:Cna B-type domain-containing protein n=1 Tax=Sedimentibacter hydroxybenzoicus DSM 7310 TaxID=1123245 RepID=A0A974BLF0_SEDHY|nr:Cna B-type domain-containing protein [Sedimentibacter hydroxybenzoicus]NYB74986.1 Cna B-type domain-containing protein [Sedimentibacter hydroxybenzoicus DSM 7310]